MTNTIYIHQPEKAVSFTRLPNFLFEAPTFTPLSNEAKVLYAFILRRTDLSRKNGWADEYGRIYLYYPICEVVDLLHCGRQKAVNTLRELQYAELIDIKKQGCGKPKIDLTTPEKLEELVDKWKALLPAATIVPVSATSG